MMEMEPLKGLSIISISSSLSSGIGREWGGRGLTGKGGGDTVWLAQLEETSHGRSD